RGLVADTGVVVVAGESGPGPEVDVEAAAEAARGHGLQPERGAAGIEGAGRGGQARTRHEGGPPAVALARGRRQRPAGVELEVAEAGAGIRCPDHGLQLLVGSQDAEAG